jgi:hypothetical protein
MNMGPLVQSSGKDFHKRKEKKSPDTREKRKKKEVTLTKSKQQTHTLPFIDMRTLQQKRHA